MSCPADSLHNSRAENDAMKTKGSVWRTSTAFFPPITSTRPATHASRATLTSLPMLVLWLGLTMAGSAAAQSSDTMPEGTLDHISVHGASLAGNLEGDDPNREVIVYLPPGYATDEPRRYPVVYFLHGYSLTAERMKEFPRAAGCGRHGHCEWHARDDRRATGCRHTSTAAACIQNSPTTGNWGGVRRGGSRRLH